MIEKRLALARIFATITLFLLCQVQLYSAQFYGTNMNGDTDLLSIDDISSIIDGVKSLAAPSASTGLGATRTTNHSLSATCADQYCDMLVTALSCNVIGIHLRKICAGYFVGAITGCPSYPSQSELYNAPYFCAVQLGDLLTTLGIENNLQNLKGEAVIDHNDISESVNEVSVDPFYALLSNGLDYDPYPTKVYDDVSLNVEDHRLAKDTYLSINDVMKLKRISRDYHSLSLRSEALPFSTSNITLNFTVIENYLTSNMTENCQKKCYQNYINQGNILFEGSCRSESMNPNNLVNYKFLKLLSLHQELRNQICVENPLTEASTPNCYNALTSLASSSGSVTSLSSSPLFSLTCEYNIANVPNFVVQSILSGQIQKFGCCFANQVAMLVQNPITSPLIFPPCLLRYFSVNNAKISPSNFCTTKANGNMTVFEFTINITSNTGGNAPVDVYSSSSILFFQGLMTEIFNGGPSVAATLPPYTLNYEQPLQIEIINYLYYQGATLVTPSNGRTNTTDYTKSTKVSITALLVIEGLKTDAEVEVLADWISSATLNSYISLIVSYAYTKGASYVAYTASISTNPDKFVKQFVADPIELTSGSIMMFSYQYVMLSSIVVMTLIGYLTI